VECFKNVASAASPTLLPREKGIPEEPSISLLPDLPEDEAGYQLPDPIQEGGMKWVVPPIGDGICNIVSNIIRGAHYEHHLIPDLCRVWAGGKEVIHGFGCFHARECILRDPQSLAWRGYPR
jgi:hypothetical protein